MANTITLTSLAPVIYAAQDIVARELTGAINSVTINSSGVDRASYGDTVQSFITAQPTLNTSYTPAMAIPDGDDQTVAADTFALNKVANVKIPLKGETARQLDNSYGSENVQRDMFAQAFRTIINAIETEACSVIYKGASRATGTAGTTPFATDFDAIADLRKILVDNGCPMSDGLASIVLNTAAGTKLRQLAQLQKVNESGSNNLLRQGELLNLQGFSLKESAGIASHTKGAGTGYDFVVGGEAIGQTILSLEGGTVNTTGFKAGDVITHAGDTVNKYVVKTGLTATSGDIVINAPGLRIAGVDANEITIGDSYTANLGFHKNAIELAMRAPAQPQGGDAAVDRMTVSDPATGLVFEIAQYKGYGMEMFDITVFYGVKVWKPEFVATLLG